MTAYSPACMAPEWRDEAGFCRFALLRDKACPGNSNDPTRSSGETCHNPSRERLIELAKAMAETGRR